MGSGLPRSMAPSRACLAVLTVVVLVLTACTAASDTDPDEHGAVVATLDYESDTVTVNVVLTDEGFDPETIFIPVGRQVRIVLRNRGVQEHHYRVVGLIPAELSWYLYPEIDEDDLEYMTADELAALGLGDDVDDVDHELHHLTPVFVPFREESRAGVKPLPNEVHGYAHGGGTDIMAFFPTNVGTFVVEDVLNPEITGRVVVFDAKS